MEAEKRLTELIELTGSDTATYGPLLREMVYLEGQLDELRDLPKIRVNPKDPTQQKTTPAAKLYKEMLQQYTNCVRILMKATGVGEMEEESPLRLWFSKHE